MVAEKTEWTKQQWISWAEEEGLPLTLAQKRMVKSSLIKEIEDAHEARTTEIPESLADQSVLSPKVAKPETYRQSQRYTR